jgi:hypothetical protein
LKLLTVKSAILVAVVEICTNPVTNHNAQVFVEGEIARVKNAMDVPPQKQAIRNFVFAASTVRLNVRRV